MSALAERVRTAPGSFMRWWLGELGSFLPSWLKTGSDGTRSSLILDVGHESIVLKARTPRGEETISQTAGIHAAHEATALSGLRERRHRRWPLIVRLAADLGMRRTVDLPLAARSSLDDLLTFELDRLTPFKADEVCFAWRVVETDRAKGRMAVLLEMAPKALVDRVLDVAAAHGRSADRVEIEGAGGRQPLNLTPKDTAPQAERGWLRAALPVIVLGLALVAAWLPFERQQRAIERLDREIGAIKPTAEESLAIRERLDAELSEADFLTRAKNDRTSMTRLLAELTELLPDQSHLVQLDIDGSTIKLQGLADKASDLITILDRSALFTSPQFRSPVTRDPRSGKERFQITVELGGLSS